MFLKTTKKIFNYVILTLLSLMESSMSQIVFVPHLPLESHSHLSCSNDMRVPNRLQQYKNLLFTHDDVTYFKLTPEDMAQRAQIFAMLQGHDAIVREFVDNANYVYVLEILVSSQMALDKSLSAVNIQFNI